MLLGKIPGEGTGYPLQNSGLENSKDYIAHGVFQTRVLEWGAIAFSNHTNYLYI